MTSTIISLPVLLLCITAGPTNARKSTKSTQPRATTLSLTNAEIEMLTRAHADFTKSAFPEMDYPGAPAVAKDYGATIESVDGGTTIRFSPDSTYKGPRFEGGTIRYEFGSDAGLLHRVFEK